MRDPEDPLMAASVDVLPALYKTWTGNELPEFDRDNPACHDHVRAEWAAFREGREFSVFPYGWQPLPGRPNGWFDDDVDGDA